MSAIRMIPGVVPAPPPPGFFKFFFTAGKELRVIDHTGAISTVGVMSGAAISAALDALFGNSDWRANPLTGSAIVAAIDATLTGTGWRTPPLSGPDLIAAINAAMGSTTWQLGGTTLSGAEVVDLIDTTTGSTFWRASVSAIITALDTALGGADQWRTTMSNEEIVLRINSFLGGTTWQGGGGGGGAAAFTDLSDAPSTYADKQNFLVKVNAAGTGLEFGTADQVAVAENITTVERAWASDGDINGVFYYAGQNFNPAGTWTNPYTASRLGISISGELGGSWGTREVLVDRNPSAWHSTDASGSWVAFDLGETVRLIPSRYTMRSRHDSTLSRPLHWKLQGSNDGLNWTDLDTVTGYSWASQGAWASRPVTTTQRYRHLRILQTGANSGGTDHLTVGELEVYGTLQTGVGETPGTTARIRTVTSTTDTLRTTDRGNTVRFLHANPTTVTLPKNGIPGSAIVMIQRGGQLTFTPETGATMLNRQGHAKSAGVGAFVTAFCDANADGSTAAWIIGGDTAA